METMKKWNHNLAYACNKTETGAEILPEPEITLENYTQFEGVPAPESRILAEAEITNSRQGKLHEEDGYFCDVCKNRGYFKKTVYIRDRNIWANVEPNCECMTVRRNLERLRSCGLKDVIEKYRFDTYHTDEPWQQKVKAMAQDFVQNSAKNGSWFFVGGNTGAGKSHICTAICRELILSGKDVRYMMWRDESVRLKALLNDDAAYQNIVRELKEAEVLYIDDLFKSGKGGGSQNVTDADIKLAYEILNYRSMNPAAVTILSSESTLDEIFRMDGATGGRIGERAKGYMINLTGDEKNYRKKMMAG